MTPSSGSTPTSSLRSRSSRRSRRRWRPCVTPLLPSCTRVQEEQECPTWEVCQEAACQEQEAPLQEADLDPDQPLRKSTKLCPLPPSHIKIVFETYVILLQPAFLFSISVRT